jgi:hypothetical protein
MKTILDFLNSILAKKNLLIFILLAVVTFLIMSKWQSCNAAKEDKKTAEQNLEAMKKVVTIEKNKNGELQSSIVAFVGKAGDLEVYSKGLKDEVDALKHRKPEIIIKTELVYIHDTVKIANTLTDKGNGNYDLNWDYTSKDSSRMIKGTSSFNAIVDLNKIDFSYKLKVTAGQTSIDKDMLKIGLVVGVAKNKKTGFEEIFVTPKDTNIKVGTLEGAILNRKKDKKFSVGPLIGYGISYGAGRVALGPFIGIGLQYSLFKF